MNNRKVKELRKLAKSLFENVEVQQKYKTVDNLYKILKKEYTTKKH